MSWLKLLHYERRLFEVMISSSKFGPREHVRDSPLIIKIAPPLSTFVQSFRPWGRMAGLRFCRKINDLLFCKTNCMSFCDDTYNFRAVPHMVLLPTLRVRNLALALSSSTRSNNTTLS
ncbi:hypothetical protein PGT21_034604 [Puccinia graminis f. sp. tritici]|uniref:Uncharacterized protein n=1 Tax=Puccinia graminis f. sp. tritici TaxID=56615 RepID=A0A5B0N873_PUCGR|nr:hypothetical protein PGT21_034604 [Puccinia graminis f. sp. tritici]